MNKEVIFVPGRLCIFGEHSDWASEYVNQNSNIKDGHTIVATLDNGITATIKKKTHEFILIEKNKIFRTELDINSIENNLKGNEYYCFVAAVVTYMLVNYKIGGVQIDIIKNDLPEKKGLSSSASICVLVCRAFNKLYNLKLNEKEEMEIAYLCERQAKSLCGKMDQIVALKSGVYHMRFHNGEVDYSNIKVGRDIYMVFADLNASKETKKILQDLHKAFPFPKNQKEENALKYLGSYNEEIVNDAIKFIEKGDSKELGKLMTKAQELFDKNVAPLSPKELKSPKLHAVLNDEFVKQNSLGGKGVGSQGDGSVQFIVENAKQQEELINYLNKKLNLIAYPLKIKKSIRTQNITKAIIPLGGLGTRMYPFTNSFPKSFIPIVKDNEFKPIFQILIEELIDAGIERIALVINKSQKDIYSEFFSKLNNNLDKHIKFYYEEEQLGLGNAILCAKDFINNEPFMLVLGDQIYTSFEEKSCTKQLIEKYNELNRNIISVCKEELKNIEKYGVFFGENINNNIYRVTKILEKPSIEQAKAYNKIKNSNDYYIAFGEYIIDDKIMKKLDNYKKKNTNKILPFTELLEETYNELYCYIPNGKMYDMGNINSYLHAIRDIYK